MMRRTRQRHPAPVPYVEDSFPLQPHLQAAPWSCEGSRGVVLTWNLSEVHSTDIKNFEVYFYQQTFPGLRLTEPSVIHIPYATFNYAPWSLLMKVKHISLPRNVFINLPEKYTYHFIVRVHDVEGRRGIFSAPVSVHNV